MIIDCGDCEFQGTDQCSDCLVTAVLSIKDRKLALEPEEEEAVSELQKAGLAPPLRFKRKAV